MGGIYGEHQITATGRRAPLKQSWTHPHLARKVVVVTDGHPKEELPGLYGEITDEVDESEIYTAQFIEANGFERHIRYQHIPISFLYITDHRLPPAPVPRPTRTSHPGRDKHNLVTAYEFDTIDEIDHYL